ncbi:FAD-dependent oxidoreductase [Saccharothrix obliqua]|uniref:FAD-dependent oxidoreductase n=1 Tax=Saccharothrix obliqua TaxID=2861747 RepID=UPI001C5D7A12|nr:FAD-dependent monooxygenase [Saccharothrix obliqua]MBW4721434.1 FAD-dependent monooxygenase [Saccharothrix obliqua]
MRVAVIGAGPAGLAVTLALRRAGIDARCWERARELPAEGTGLTLWPNGLAALDRFHAGDVVRAAGLAAEGIAIRTAGGRTLHRLSSDDMESVGGNGIGVHRAELVAALAGLLPRGTVRYGAECVGVETVGGRARAVFRDGTSTEADVVVAADGAGSTARAAIGLDVPWRGGGSTVWRAVVELGLPPGPGLLTMGGDLSVGVWRLPGDRVYWFASGPRPGPRPPDRLRDWHEPVPELLAATPTERFVVTGVRDRGRARSWHRGRVVLVGDAAHPGLPHMGQGTSQAFEDALVLADRLRSTVDVAAALRSYEESRRKRAEAANAQARALAAVGAWHHPLACRLRETAVAAMPRALRLRQLAALFRLPR